MKEKKEAICLIESPPPITTNENKDSLPKAFVPFVLHRTGQEAHYPGITQEPMSNSGTFLPEGSSTFQPLLPLSPFSVPKGIKNHNLRKD